MAQFWCRLASDCCFLQYGCWYHQNVEAWNNTVSVSQLVESEHKTHVCGFNSGSKIRCGAIAVNSVGLSPPKTDVGYTVVEGKWHTFYHSPYFPQFLIRKQPKTIASNLSCKTLHCVFISAYIFNQGMSSKICNSHSSLGIALPQKALLQNDDLNFADCLSRSAL